MDVAAYPSQAMVFCGALVMQSFLCRRKVTEPGDLRTNLYVLAHRLSPSFVIGAASSCRAFRSVSKTKAIVAHRKALVAFPVSARGGASANRVE